MEGFSIELNTREETGSASARRIRSAGKIPAIVYHKHEASIMASVDYNSFLHLAEKAKPSQVFAMVSTDEKLNGKAALVKDIQKDYVSGKLLHVDFQALRDDEEITVEVSLNIVGEAPGVKLGGGVLTVLRHELLVTCLPKDIPLSIDVSIASLQINESIFTRDVILPEGVKFLGDGDEPVANISASSVEEEPKPAAEAAAGATPEAAKAAEPAKK